MSNNGNFAPLVASRDGSFVTFLTPCIAVPYNPTSNDSNVQLFQSWQNTVTKSFFVYSGAGAWVQVTSGTGGDITSLPGDTGGALSPVAGNINIVGGSGVVVAGSGNTLTIDVFGTNEGTVTTVGATTGNVITYDLGAAGVYSLDIFIEGYDAATPAGVAYAITGGVRTTGSAGVLIGAPMIDAFEEAALSAADVALAISGNSLQIAVTGVAGKTIVWKARLEFIRS